jgi:hypothetical protein
LERAEEHLDKVIEQLELDCLDLSYEELCQEPNRHLVSILREIFPETVISADLEVWSALACASSHFIPTANKESQEWANRFLHDKNTRVRA